jgi:hypothetical protein
MKLKNRNYYQCDVCKIVLSHKDMHDDNLCYECYENKKDEEICRKEWLKDGR